MKPHSNIMGIVSGLGMLCFAIVIAWTLFGCIQYGGLLLLYGLAWVGDTLAIVTFEFWAMLFIVVPVSIIAIVLNAHELYKKAKTMGKAQ